MSSDLDAFAIGGFAEIGGLKLHLTPLTAEDMAEARAYVRSLTANPMEGVVEVCNSVHPEVAKVLMAEAFREKQKWGSLTEGFGANWAGGWEGQAFFLFRSSRKYHPELTKEQCDSLAFKDTQEKRDAFMQKLADLSGLLPDPTKTPKPTTQKKRKRK